MPSTKTAASSETLNPMLAARAADDPTYQVDPGKGWIIFAGIMLGVIGVLNLAYGIAAVGDSKFFVRDIQFILGSLHTWGWILIVVGVAQMVISIGIWRMSEVARWAGILVAGGNMVVQFFALPMHPVWALTVFFIDVIVIFGLLTYGGRDRYSLAG
jgi:hypothetical protein